MEVNSGVDDDKVCDDCGKKKDVEVRVCERKNCDRRSCDACRYICDDEADSMCQYAGIEQCGSCACPHKPLTHPAWLAHVRRTSFVAAASEENKGTIELDAIKKDEKDEGDHCYLGGVCWATCGGAGNCSRCHTRVCGYVSDEDHDSLEHPACIYCQTCEDSVCKRCWRVCRKRGHII